MTTTTYPVPVNSAQRAYITAAQYQTLYQQSIDDPATFWAQQARELITWQKPWQRVLSGDFRHANVTWFQGATLNPCYNCVDRHLPQHAERIAFYWQGDEPEQTAQFSYAELHKQVCLFANVLKEQGVGKGDRVCLYLPMIPEAVFAMLACCRIGAVHTVVFAGFSAHALQERILAAECRIVITADAAVRGGKITPLKQQVDQALKACPAVSSVLVVQGCGNKVKMQAPRDRWYHEQKTQVSSECPCVELDAHDPLFILYTSGSTGKPKGIQHSVAGYLLYASATFRYVFNYHLDDIFCCAADIGWITGHSYLVYGPLCNAATMVMFAGTLDYPSFDRYWQLVDHYKISIFYTAPTAIRALMKEGEKYLQTSSRQSLRLLGTVGEPINPDVWQWYYHEVGQSRCPIVDTWWQTETGGIMLTPLPGATVLKPGMAMKPFFGVVAAVVDAQGQAKVPNQEGYLVIKQAWPGMLQTIHHNPARFYQAYFAPIPGVYLTGDAAIEDDAGDIRIIGRIDDVINVAGHRLGSAEIENALLTHPAIAEAAVVAQSDVVKGHSVCVFAIIKTALEQQFDAKQVTNELKHTVRRLIGPIATPKNIIFVTALPKTRSGKIMRRLLGKLVNGQTTALGDTSTLANAEVLADLIKQVQQLW